MSELRLVITLPNGKVSEALPNDPAYAQRVIADLAVFIPNATWEVQVHNGPVCQDCGEATKYRRGISGGGGVSQWVHTDTGQARCADGKGHASRPADWDARRSA